MNNIPNSAISQAKATLHIAYGHTSHGSQLIAGMGGSGGTGLDTFLTDNPNYEIPSGLYLWNEGGINGALDLDDYAMGGDVGYYPQWVNNTLNYLGVPDPATGRGSLHSNVNVIIWSWCGQAASRTEATMISTYLAPMTQLEADYPGITFVYMTGHLDGSGASGNLHLRNQQIRQYCRDNDKTLYDFADIESYGPEGLVNYMELMANDNCDYDNDDNGSRESNWALAWQSIHDEDIDWWASGAAHSQHLNGNLKGFAAWWLWARLAGWSGIDYEIVFTDPDSGGSCNGNGPCYLSIQTALNENSDKNCHIKIRQAICDENVVFSGPNYAILDGGWDEIFSENSGLSTISGRLTINGGCLICSNLIVE
ncbi:MAG: hypothetical protein JXR89_04725 [Deltaproteobacteria bacterium]|nr:hypothetical protein [Deltaproteobacteria bacterium]